MSEVMLNHPQSHNMFNNWTPQEFDKSQHGDIELCKTCGNVMMD